MSQAAAHQRMFHCDTRRMQSERAGFQSAFLHVFLKETEQELILVVLIRAYIEYKVQTVGDYIVLRAALHLRFLKAIMWQWDLFS